MELGAQALGADGKLAFQRVAHKHDGVDYATENIFPLFSGSVEQGDIFRTDHEHDVVSSGSGFGQDA